MTRRRLSLRWFLLLSVLGITVLLVVGYSLLSARFFIRGMDAIVASNLERAALRRLGDFGIASDDLADDQLRFNVTAQWAEQPLAIREAFPQAPSENGVLLKRHMSGWLERPDLIHFVMRVDVEPHRVLYVSYSASAATASRLIGRNVMQSFSFLLGLSLSIVLVLALVIWLLYRRISRPVAALVDWTRSLQPASLRAAPPSFDYPELDTLAGLIRGSLLSVQQSIDREHRFLRHTSHELRTPISVIRSNVALMRKLPQYADVVEDSRFADAVGRIDRASLTMQHLAQTLLWLRQEDSEPLPTQRVQLDELIAAVYQELRYLAQGKPVDAELRVAPVAVEIAEVPARIVVGNLIRNALQHSWEGTIRIDLHDATLVVSNPLPTEDVPPAEQGSTLGFGLGLQLTQQLCERLGWQIEVRQDVDSYRVSVRFEAGQSA